MAIALFSEKNFSFNLIYFDWLIKKDSTTIFKFHKKNSRSNATNIDLDMIIIKLMPLSLLEYWIDAGYFGPNKCIFYLVTKLEAPFRVPLF